MAQTVEAGGGGGATVGAGWSTGAPPPYSRGVQAINVGGHTYYYQPPTGSNPGFVVFPGLGWLNNVSSVDPHGWYIYTEAPNGQSGGGTVSIGVNNGTFGMSLKDANTGNNIQLASIPANSPPPSNPAYAPPPKNIPMATVKAPAAPAAPVPPAPRGGSGGGAGGGGGGRGAVNAGGGGGNPALPPQTKYNAQQLEAQFGYAAEFFKDTGLTNLIAQAVAQQWNAQDFAAHLMGTKWYKTHSAAQRQWEQLRTSDPAEARNQQNTMLQQIQDRASTDGVALSPARASALALAAVQSGWNSDQINKALASEYRYNSSNPGAIADSLKQQASQYLVPMSDRAMQSWAQDVISGRADPNSFDAYLKEQAKSLFPGMGAAIDSGITPANYVEPYKQIAAQTLELPPDSVNFTDPKWSKALFQVDPKTGARTSMSLADWQNTLRTDPTYHWDQTQQAQSAAADLVNNMQKTFG